VPPASRRLPPIGMKKIAIIGPVASGKTTLGGVVASELGLPFVELGNLLQRSGAPTDAWADIQDAVVELNRWVISGEYLDIAEPRLLAADTVIWLDLPRWVCVCRALRQTTQSYAPRTSRLKSLSSILRYTSHGRRQTEQTLKKLDVVRVVHRLRTRKEVAEFRRRIRALKQDDAPRTMEGFVWMPRPEPHPSSGEDWWCVRDAFCALMNWPTGSEEWNRFIEGPAPGDMERLTEWLGLEWYDPEHPAHRAILLERLDHPGIAVWALHGSRMAHVIYQPTLRRRALLPAHYVSHQPELYRFIVDAQQPSHA
jgi:adenylate kinase family enzyme